MLAPTLATASPPSSSREAELCNQLPVCFAEIDIYYTRVIGEQAPQNSSAWRIDVILRCYILNTHWITNIFLTAIIDELIDLIELIELISLIHSHIPNYQLRWIKWFKWVGLIELISLIHSHIPNCQLWWIKWIKWFKWGWIKWIKCGTNTQTHIIQLYILGC